MSLDPTKEKLLEAAKKWTHFSGTKLLKTLLTFVIDEISEKNLPPELRDDPRIIEAIRELRYKVRGVVLSEVNSHMYTTFAILQIVSLGGLIPDEFYSEDYVAEVFHKPGRKFPVQK